jgi:hypothetical protein
MRLLKPTPGECADRQTILELKIKAGGGRREETAEDVDTKEEADTQAVYGVNRWILKDPSHINIQPFLDESEMLQQYLEANWFPALEDSKGSDFDKLYEQLADVNQQLWTLTDQQHTLRDAPDRMQDLALKRAAEVLFTIADLNDKRAELVYKMNELFSIKVQEKIFA